MSAAKKPAARDDLFAFWRYDLFPYCLGSAGHWTDDGKHFVAQRYSGAFLREAVITTYPRVRGEEILAELEDLRAEHRRETELLNARFEQRACEILPELKKVRPRR